MAAIEASLAGEQALQASVLARALQPLLVLRGLWGSWDRLISWASEAAHSHGERAMWAWAEHERGTLAGLRGDRGRAAEHLQAAERLRRRIGDEAGAAASHANLVALGLARPPARTSPSRRAHLAVLLLLIVLLLGAGGMSAQLLAPALPGGAAPAASQSAAAP